MTTASAASKDDEDDKMDGSSASRSEDANSGDKQQAEGSIKFEYASRLSIGLCALCSIELMAAL